MLTKVSFAKCLFVTVAIVLLTCVSLRQATKQAQNLDINDKNWIDLMQGEWLVDFHAPWCPACKRLKPEWDRLVEWSNDLNIKVASADVTKHPGLSGRFMVSGLPTIYHVKDGLFRIYNGPKDHSALINFVEEQGWKNVEPVSRIWAPDSLQMSALAYLFQVSMALRDVHNVLTEEYGLPYYVSYTIFALCTVLVGTILGLAIVFIVDLFIPARYSETTSSESKPKTRSSTKKSDKKNDSDLEDTSVTEKEENPKSERTNVRRRA